MTTALVAGLYSRPGFLVPRKLGARLQKPIIPPQDSCVKTVRSRRLSASQGSPKQPVDEADDDDFEGLEPEEDWVVPGGYMDSLSSNTELGRAVDSACKELDALRELENENLRKAEELLAKVGFKGSLFTVPPPPEERSESTEDGKEASA